MKIAFDRVRLDVLLDRPLLPEIQRLAKDAGLTGYTLLPALGGEGFAGRWSEDSVTAAQSKMVFMSVTATEKAEAFIALLEPLLEPHRLMVLYTPVHVVRSSKFA